MRYLFFSLALVLFTGCSITSSLVLYNLKNDDLLVTYVKYRDDRLIYADDTLQVCSRYKVDSIYISPCQGLVIGDGWRRAIYGAYKLLYADIKVYAEDSLRFSVTSDVRYLDIPPQSYNQLCITNRVYIDDECGELNLAPESEKMKKETLFSCPTFVVIK